MRGGEWVVPVVVLIVWLVSTILKSREQNEPVRVKPGGGDGRKPTGDIDKFLQEIDRLRRKTAEEQGQAAAPPPRVRPVAPPVVRARPAPRMRAANRVAEPLEVVPVLAPPRTPLASEFVAPVQMTKPLGVAQVSMTELRQSPGVTAALHLLRSHRTLAAAVVLQEVLGPPKCKR